MRRIYSLLAVALSLLILSHLTAATAQVAASRAVARRIIRVPQDVLDLQDAIYRVDDGGVIELAEGTYNAPTGGFRINNLGKSFTVQAAEGASVTLDGGGAHNVIRFINSDRSSGGLVAFQGLTFAHGRSTTDGIAGGVTLQKAEARFVDCAFQNNVGAQPFTGGGGILVAVESTATFRDCTWDGNAAYNFGGGLAIETQSEAHVHSSHFTRNRANLPEHAPTAAGGGIHVGNSTLQVSDTLFEDNQAGYVGGAIYAIGTWSDPASMPRAYVSVSRSAFINNRATRDPSVSFASPTEGGAFHAEDATTASISDSRFVGNRAMTGGGLSLYRAIAEISSSVFEGNRATGAGTANGFGGAISILSNDTPADGSINRRSGRFTMKNSVVEGGTPAGQAGGGLYASGDGNRTYGLNGVSQMGTAADNRARVTLTNVIFANTDVQEAPGVPGSGVGGGLLVDLADLTVQDSMIILADALGSGNSSGGGLAAINQSLAKITDVTFARNTAGKFGAGVFVKGSAVRLSNCKLIENEISPGVSEPASRSYGAAIFTAPDPGRDLPVTGMVDKCIISNNDGLPIFDDDRTDGPINAVQYNSNRVYTTTFGDVAYTNSIAGYCCRTIAELNSLIITRSNGTNTPKSQRSNSSPGQMPIVGTLLAAPPYIPPQPSSVSNLGYAWSGGPATLDGVPVSGNAGLTETSGGGRHTLLVNGAPFTVEIITLDEEIFLPISMR